MNRWLHTLIVIARAIITTGQIHAMDSANRAAGHVVYGKEHFRNMVDSLHELDKATEAILRK